MIRNIEELNLDEITPEFLLDQCIEMGEALEVDTRQGSLYRDAASGHIIRISKLFDDLRMIRRIISLDTCTGDILDEYMKMRGLKRNPEEPTPAQYYVEFSGIPPQVGALMMCQGHLFRLAKATDGERYVIVSEEKGTALNDLQAGTPVIPDVDVDNLMRATLQELAVPGLGEENDDQARLRLQNRMSGPDENGNKSQIRTWCESVEGVGRTRVIPLWKGANTVAGVVITEEGLVPTGEVVEKVQEYVDPGGSGMGEGAATIGQFFTALAPDPVIINISVMIIKSADATYDEIKEEFITKLKEYFKGIAMSEYSSRDMILKARHSRIGALLSDIDAVVDYEDLKINGGSENISLSIYQIPVVGEVTVDGDIS